MGWNDYASGAMMVVRSRLEQCQSWLQGWSRHKYGNVEKAVKKKTKQLAQLQQEDGEGNQEAVIQLQLEID